MLGAIASATSRVRLATGILIAPLRPAALLAKQAATLDVMSRGRLDLGVGTGWQREEYDAEGIDFARRGQLLSDTLAACKVLWRDTPAALDTPTLSFRDVYCEPQAAAARRCAAVDRRRAARAQPRAAWCEWGDAWIPIMGASLDDIADGARRIADAWRAAGRDPAALQVQAPLRIERGDDGRPDLARSMASVPELVAAGATDVHVTLRAFNSDPAEAPGGVRRDRAPVRRRSDVSSRPAHYGLARADTLRRLSDPPDAAADRAPRDRRPEPLRPVLVQRLHRGLLLRGGHGRVPEPRHHRRRVRGRARRRAALGVRVRAAFPRTGRRRASGR